MINIKGGRIFNREEFQEMLNGDTESRPCNRQSSYTSADIVLNLLNVMRLVTSSTIMSYTPSS